MNLFYETSINKFFLCNYPESVNTWKDKPYNNEILSLPLCIPIDIIVYFDDHVDDLELTYKYSSDHECLKKILIKWKEHIKCAINIIENDISIREIQEDDYDRGYVKLMYEFTNYNYPITKKKFVDYLQDMKSRNTICVVHSKKDNRIIGAGTIFKLNKLHNNPVGQIEDFIITENYRHTGLGSKLLSHLTRIGIEQYKCYKVILKTHKETSSFYLKNGFIETGIEMKLM